jgi:hypothetical protein
LKNPKIVFFWLIDMNISLTIMDKAIMDKEKIIG